MPAQRSQHGVKGEVKTPTANGSRRRSSSISGDNPGHELANMRHRLAVLEADVQRLGGLVEQQAKTVKPPPIGLLTRYRHCHDDMSLLRSVYVANVHYGATAEELDAHFGVFGPICRITILCCANGRPRGQALVEFASQDSAAAALAHNGGVHYFRGRALFVEPRHRGGAFAARFYNAGVAAGDYNSSGSSSSKCGAGRMPDGSDAPGPTRRCDHLKQEQRHAGHASGGRRYKPY